MFLSIWALTTNLPKRKEISLDFFIEQLVKNNQQMQALKAEYASKRKSRIRAFSEFLPKVNAGASYNFADKNKFGIKTDEWNKSKSGEISAEWNVFNSFGDVADLKAGKAYIEGEKYSYYKNVSKLFLDALESLLKMNASMLNLEVTHNSASKREDIYNIANNKYRHQTMAMGELKNAEAQWENMKNHQYAADAQYQGAVAEFIAYTGIPVEHNYVVDLPNDLPKTYEEAEALMLKNNFEIQATYHKVEQVKAGLFKATAKFGPKVGLQGSVSRNFDDPKEEYNWSGGIKGTINLFNGFSDISMHQEQSKQLTAARCQHQSVLAQKRAELKSVWVTYHNGLEQKVLLEKAVAAYEIVASSAMVRFESGAKDVSSVADAQDYLAEAKKRHFENEKVLRLNAWRLKILVGDIKSILKKLDE